MLQRIVFIFLVVGLGAVGCASKTRTSRSSAEQRGLHVLSYKEAEAKYASVDPNRTSSFAGSQFDGRGGVKAKKFGGAKSAYSKTFRTDAYDTRSFYGGKKKAHDKTFATSQASLSTKGRTVKNIDKPFGTRTADTREFSTAHKSSSYDSAFSTHASTFRGKEQKRLDLEHLGREELTLDDVREILNKR